MRFVKFFALATVLAAVAGCGGKGKTLAPTPVKQPHCNTKLACAIQKSTENLMKSRGYNVTVETACDSDCFIFIDGKACFEEWASIYADGTLDEEDTVPRPPDVCKNVMGDKITK